MSSKLTTKDVELLKKRDKLRSQLKKLETQLKPRIEILCTDHNGETIDTSVGSVKFEQITSSAVQWKTLATALLDDKDVEEALPSFSNERVANRVTLV